MSNKPFGPGKTLAILLVAVIVAGSWYPPLQELAAKQLDAGLERALISFATARTLNAVISVAQGTELAVHPLGVGVTVTIGQVLDPLNDLIEQFSSLMLMASVAFGVQKALLLMGSNLWVSAAVTLVAALWAVLYVLNHSPAWLARLLMVLLLVRFAVPVMTIGSDQLFEHFLAQDYQTHQQSIAATSKAIAQQATTKTDRSIVDSIKDKIALPGKELVERYEAMKQILEQSAVRVVRLIVIFLLQTLVLPLILLWLLYRVTVGLLRPGPAGPG